MNDVITQEDIGKYKNFLDAMVELQRKIDFYKESLKETKKDFVSFAKEHGGLTTTQLNTLFKLYYNENGDEYFEEQENLEALYETIVNKQ